MITEAIPNEPIEIKDMDVDGGSPAPTGRFIAEQKLGRNEGDGATQLRLFAGKGRMRI